MTTPSPRATTLAPVVVASHDGLHVPGLDAALLAGHHVGAVTVDDNAMWAIVDGTELHRVDPDGTTTRVAALTDGAATCVHVHGGTVWVGGDDAGLWRLRAGALEPVTSFADAPTRSEWHTPWGGPPSVLSMASHDDDLYVSVHVGGILRTSDDGATWHDTIDLHVDVHEVAVDPHDGTVWAATGMRALARSTDRGVSWQFHTERLHATYSLALAVTDAGVLCGASSGHAGRDGALYRFAGGQFARVTDGLPDHFDGAIGPGRIVGRGAHAAVLLPGGRLFTSSDGGRRWSGAGEVTGATAIALR